MPTTSPLIRGCYVAADREWLERVARNNVKTVMRRAYSRARGILEAGIAMATVHQHDDLARQLKEVLRDRIQR